MVEQDLLHLSINGYQLGSSFCRKGLQRRGVCIFVKKDQHFNKIDISHHSKEQGLEICAILLVTKTANLIIVIKLFCNWTLSIVSFLLKKPTTFQRLDTQLDPIDRAGPYLRTTATTQEREYKLRTAQTIRER
jgi:hypothetical protein